MVNHVDVNAPVLKLIFGCILFFGFGVHSARAQYHFESWTTDAGLPQNSVLSILQTHDGYLWLSTNDGLVRFDGVKFEVFDSGNSPGICCNRFTKLFEDTDGSLLAGTDEGKVIRFQNGHFDSFDVAIDVAIDANSGHINSFQSDRDGNLFISTGAGLVRGRPGAFTKTDTEARVYFLDSSNRTWFKRENKLLSIAEDRTDSFELPSSIGEANLLYEDHQHAIWAGFTNGLVRVDRGVAKIFGAESGLPQLRVTSFVEDRAGNLWIGTRTGLIRFSNDSFTTFTTADGLSSNDIRSLVLDREGNVWIGTYDQGLDRLIPQIITSLHQSEGSPALNIYPVFEDHMGTIWLGSWTSGVLNLTDGKLRPVDSAGRSFGVLPLAFAEDRDGKVWIASYEGVWWYKDGRFTDFTHSLPDAAIEIHAILQDKSGAMWFGSIHGLVRIAGNESRLYTQIDGLADNAVKSLLEDRSGRIWVGTGNGLTCIDNGRLVSYTTQNGLGSNHIRELHEDENGTIWIGTTDGGLSRLKDGHITTYLVNNGLYSKGVFRILDDDRGNFWMSSNSGIFRVAKQQLEDFAAGRLNWITSVGYGKKDGMSEIECNGGSQPAGVKTRDGRLIFPTRDGIAIVDLRQLHLNPLPPLVRVESVNLNGKPIDNADPIQFAYNPGEVEFHFQGLSFTRPGAVRFRYRLDGLDNQWIDAGNRRIAVYPRLPPGVYTFLVAAANSDGVWSDAAGKIKIRVAAPYWRTWRFRALVALALIVSICGVYWLSIIRYKRDLARQQSISRQLIDSQENERRRIARELHDDVVQRLVSLGISTFTLQSQIPEPNEEVRNAMMQIHDRTMGLTDDIRRLSHSLHPATLQHVGLVPAIIALCDDLRSQTDIQITEVIDEQLTTLNPDVDLCLYRVTQEALRNVQKHAMAASVLISLNRIRDEILLIISDDGVGFTQPSDGPLNGLGLHSLQERVNSVGGGFRIQSTTGRGTEVTVSIPIAKVRASL